MFSFDVTLRFDLFWLDIALPLDATLRFGLLWLDIGLSLGLTLRLKELLLADEEIILPGERPHMESPR